MAANATRTATRISPRSTGSESGETLQCVTVVGFNIPPWGVGHLAFRNNDDVQACVWFAASEQLTGPPFCPVAHHCVADLLAGSDAQARRAKVVWKGETGHEPPAEAHSAVVNLHELRPAAQLHRDEETVSRLRPFARRRFKTIRPFFVLIRTRKPCVRRRRRRLGWYVRFIENPQEIEKNGNARTYNPNRARTSCQRTTAYATVALPPRARLVHAFDMKFGLIPEFSTPVQKPVENAVSSGLVAGNRNINGHFSMATPVTVLFYATFCDIWLTETVPSRVR